MGTPFKMRPFSGFGNSSPLKQDEKELAVTFDEYQASTDTLQAFQHQRIGKGDFAHTGLDLKRKTFLEETYGKDSPEYKNFKSDRRVHGSADDFKTADTKLKGHKVSDEEYNRAYNIYHKAKIK